MFRTLSYYSLSKRDGAIGVGSGNLKSLPCGLRLRVGSTYWETYQIAPAPDRPVCEADRLTEESQRRLLQGDERAVEAAVASQKQEGSVT